MHGRALIESRFGPLGSGQQRLTLGGTEYDMATLLAQLGIEFDDAKPIDVQAADGHYVLRYLDAQDGRIVAYEFSEEFHPLGETRAHMAEWVGDDDEDFRFYAGH